MIKKIVSALLIVVLSLTFLGCNNTTEKQLATPSGITVSQEGVITWQAVENATGYIVNINGTDYAVTTNSYTVSSVVNDFTYTVTATAEGYKNSPASSVQTFKGTGTKPQPPVYNITVGIVGADQVKSGQTIKLTANVTGTVDVSVTWTVTQGSEYATIDKKGNLTASEVSGDKIIKVEARSKVDTTAFGEKVITIVAKPDLNQAMLDAMNNEYIAFDGYINIDLYDDSSLTSSKEPESSHTSIIKTAMNGVNWYAEYQNATTTFMTPVYYKNYNGLACQVGVNYMNEEEYFPMVDDFGEEVSWQNAGLYNSFVGLTVNDFTFDEETWRYVYTGSDSTLTAKVIASANPYDFQTQTFALIIEEGEVVGIYAKSEPDYTIAVGYKAIQHLYATFICGEEFVEVPTIEKYSHEDIHDGLNQAIQNMQSLQSYTLDFTDLNVSLTGSGFTESGFTETITPNVIHFKPFTARTNTAGESVREYQKNGEYGYKVMREGLYNAYYNNGEGKYGASRAYEASINNAKPTFAFAGEIFREYYDDGEGSVTYYVDEPMCSVASTFFYGVGNDINLYGIFAARGYTSETASFTPFVTVKDGYITDACFYYNIGSLIYGVVEIKYSDFNTATIPAEEMPEFEVREVPTSWAQLEIMVSQEDSTNTDDDVAVNALEYFKEFFGNENIEQDLPFFGIPLGDAFGFGLTTYYRPAGATIAKKAVVLYYDVPLDTDYTIESSLKAVDEYLKSIGFTQTGTDEFRKGDIVVCPIDENLDFMIYVYKA